MYHTVHVCHLLLVLILSLNRAIAKSRWANLAAGSLHKKLLRRTCVECYLLRLPPTQCKLLLFSTAECNLLRVRETLKREKCHLLIGASLVYSLRP